MSPVAWIVVGAVVWGALALVIGVFVGKVIGLSSCSRCGEVLGQDGCCPQCLDAPRLRRVA